MSKQKIATNCHLRWMIRRDMPEVLAIENTSFEEPLSEDDFIRCLRQRNCIGFVAEHEDKIVGFMIYELHRKMIYLLNVAVHTEYRRQGIGHKMLAKLDSKLSKDRGSRIESHVRDSNVPAHLWLRDFGFQAVSVVRDYYENTTDDAYLFVFAHGAQQ